MKARRAKPIEQHDELQLFIRIKHPTLDPAEISQALAMQPDEAIAAGPEVSSSGVQRLHSETYWIACLPTISRADVVQRFRGGLAQYEPLLPKDELSGVVNVSYHDVLILSRLKRFDSCVDFFDRINREGGSVTLIVDRGELSVVLKHALKKLAAFGMTLELD